MIIYCDDCGVAVNAKSINKLYCPVCAAARTNKNQKAWEQREKSEHKGMRLRRATGKQQAAERAHEAGDVIRSGWDDILDKYKNRRTEKEFKEIKRISKLPLTAEVFGA